MGFRMTLQTLAVLRVLLDDPLGEHYGLEISKAAGLPSGSLYPTLARLERDGWVTSDWEQLDEHEAGRRRRRYYRLTSDGAVWAGQALAATTRQLSPKPIPAPRPGLAGAQ
jgi:PadR family transcriptional regulator, regulatory protein PadR